MIAAAPHYKLPETVNRELEYLLLGDLREVLEEPAGPQTARWMLAILDMLLVNRPQARPSVYLPIEGPGTRGPISCLESTSMIDKLRRLRDRVAHRSNYSALVNEIREELREVMFDRISSAACLYDA